MSKLYRLVRFVFGGGLGVLLWAGTGLAQTAPNNNTADGDSTAKLRAAEEIFRDC